MQPVVGRMRQRPGMVKHLAQIAQINPPAACRAALEMLALVGRGLVYPLATILAARDLHNLSEIAK